VSIYTQGQAARLEVGPITNIAGTAIDPSPLTLTVYEPDGTEAHAFTYGTDAELVKDATGEYHADIELTSGGMWRSVFAWGTGDEAGEANLEVWVADTVAFATVDQVERRIGRDLTAAERIQTGHLVVDATSLIADAIDKDEAWAAALDPIPARLRVTCVEAVIRVLQNPRGVRSQQEALGQYSHSESFTTDTVLGSGALMLTDREERACRRAAFGTNTGSVVIDSIVENCSCS
jgi:hypothetical protein